MTGQPVIPPLCSQPGAGSSTALDGPEQEYRQGYVIAQATEGGTRWWAPVWVGNSYRVRAEVSEDDGDELRCQAEVTDGDGKLCAAASASFVPLGPAQAVDAIGSDVTGEDSRFVRDRSETNA